MSTKHKPEIRWNKDTPWRMDSIRYRDGSVRREPAGGGSDLILSVVHSLMTPAMREEVEDRGWLRTRDGSCLRWLRPDMEKTILYQP